MADRFHARRQSRPRFPTSHSRPILASAPRIQRQVNGTYVGEEHHAVSAPCFTARLCIVCRPSVVEGDPIRSDAANRFWFGRRSVQSHIHGHCPSALRRRSSTWVYVCALAGRTARLGIRDVACIDHSCRGNNGAGYAFAHPYRALCIFSVGRRWGIGRHDRCKPKDLRAKWRFGRQPTRIMIGRACDPGRAAAPAAVSL